ncbi:hypothetical protein STANM309S_04308 [Streptomyces tanashiensis]
MRVIDGGWTCSLRASSPGVAEPQSDRVPSTDISVGLSDSSTRWCLRRRPSRMTEERSAFTAAASSAVPWDRSGMFVSLTHYSV